MDNPSSGARRAHTSDMTTLISRAQLSPTRRHHLDNLVRRGAVRSILPGVYTSEPHEDWPDRVLAAQLARPDAVLIGPTAAKLLFWPELADEQVHLAPARFREPPHWLTATRQTVAPELVRHQRDLRIADPSLAALQLVDRFGTRAITEALRRRVTTPARLVEALDLWPNRPGNLARHRVLAMARDNPWSGLELEAHRELRRHGVRGWVPNHRVRVGHSVYYLDIALPELGLAIELDGFDHHSTPEDLARDAARQNDLVLEGWTVLRFTGRTLPAMAEAIARHRRQCATSRVWRGVS